MLSELDAQINLGENLHANVTSLTLTPNGAEIALDNGVSASITALALNTFSATLVAQGAIQARPGIEYTLAGVRVEYSLPVGKLHFSFRDED